MPVRTFVSNQYDLQHDQRFRDMGLIFVNAAAWRVIYILALRTCLTSSADAQQVCV